VELTVQCAVLPECTIRLACQAQLHYAPDDGNDRSFHAPVREEIAVGPAVIRGAPDRHSRVWNGWQKLFIRCSGAAIQVTCLSGVMEGLGNAPACGQQADKIPFGNEAGWAVSVTGSRRRPYRSQPRARPNGRTR
jgi:hypothetical protein